MDRRKRYYLVALIILLQAPLKAQEFHFNTGKEYINKLYEERTLSSSSKIEIVSPEKKLKEKEKEKNLKKELEENKISAYKENLEKEDIVRIESKEERKNKLIYSKKKAQSIAQTKYRASGYVGNGGYVYSTVDAFNVDPKLYITSKKDEISREEQTLSFYIYSNYHLYINNYEILIYQGEDSNLIKPLAVIKGESLPDQESINVNLNKKMVIDDSLIYVLKVFDKNGNYDVTNPRRINLIEKVDEGKLEIKEKKLVKPQEIYGKNNLKSQNILIKGASVKILGRDFPENKLVQIEDRKVISDGSGNFVLEIIYPKGEHDVEILAEDLNDKVHSDKFTLNIKDTYSFTTGLVDLSVGQNAVKGNDMLISKDEDYSKGHFDKGRLAIYHKLKAKDMKLTVHIDTKDEKIENILDGLERRQRENVISRIDDDQIYNTYGDNSRVYSDINTQGKIYVKLEKNKSKAIFGNYETNINDNYFSNYNRNLYGGYLNYKNINSTKFGDSKHKIIAFASKPNTLYSHNEFLGTGGSLYYLSKKDIVNGSAQVWLDIRDKNTNRRVSRAPLRDGVDYELDNFLGRIILEKALSQIAKENLTEVVKSNLSGEYSYYLNVDYEYYTYETDNNKLTYGLSDKKWLNDNVALGGTYIRENRDAFDYELMGLNSTIKLSENSYLEAEIAKSNGRQTLASRVSLDGGLNFSDEKINEEDMSGKAYSLKGVLSLKDLNGKLKIGENKFGSKDNIEMWARIKEDGFSNVSEESTTDYKNYGIKGKYQLSDEVSLISRYEYYDETTKTSENRKIMGSLALKNKISDDLTLTAEAKYEEKEMTKPKEGDYLGKATLVGLKGDYKLNEKVSLNASAQTELWKDDIYTPNTLYTIGSDIKLNDKINLSMSGSTGKRGDYGTIKGNYKRNENHNIYLGYIQSNEITENRNTLTVGESYKIGEKSKVYHENQFIDSSKGNGVTEIYGASYDLKDYLTIGSSYEKGLIEKDTGDIKRDSISVYSKFNKNKLYLKNKVEYRKDREPSETTKQWGLLNKGKYVLNDEYTIVGKANYYFTDFRTKENTTFKEFGLGVAYRPVYMDKLNVLTNYSYIEDLGTEIQSKKDGELKAHILSLEGIYQLTNKLDVSLKYALRNEKERINRSSGLYVESRKNLFALKTSYDIIYNYEIFAEYHILKDEKSDNTEDGIVLGLYKDFNTNVKVGVGYNFTNYDDNLKVLDYNSNGWFINIIGKF